MKKDVHKIKIIWLVLMTLSFHIEMLAQVASSVYFFDHLPAAGLLNPSFYPNREVQISLPVISNIHIAVNNPLAYSDVFKKNKLEGFSYIDRQSVMKQLRDINLFSIDLYTVIQQINIANKRGSIGLSVAKVFTNNVFIEKDLIEILLFGNASEEFSGKTIALKKTGINTSLYHEFAISYSRHVNKKLILGTRFKYLNGTANISTEGSKVGLNTKDDLTYAMTGSANIRVNTSFAVNHFENPVDHNFEQYLWVPFTNNHGFGVDLGATYYLNPFLRFSASITDLGRIGWKENVISYVSKNPDKQFLFNGLDINDYYSNGKFDDDIQLLDSLTEHFDFVKTHQPYFTALVPKTYLSAAYDFSARDQAAILIKSAYYGIYSDLAFTLNYKRRFGDVFSIIANYTYAIPRSLVGAGFSLDAGPLQVCALHVITPTFYDATRIRNVYFQFGLVLAFGRKMDFDPPVEEFEIPDQEE